jgi:hypothetical protein
MKNNNCYDNSNQISENANLTGIIIRSFSNTKLRKDIAEEVVGRDFASDFAEVVQGLADVLHRSIKI